MHIKLAGPGLVALCLTACDSMSFSDRTTEILMFRPSDGKYALCAGSSGPSMPPFDQSTPANVSACVQHCKSAGYIEQGVRPSDAVLAAARQTTCSVRSGG